MERISREQCKEEMSIGSTWEVQIRLPSQMKFHKIGEREVIEHTSYDLVGEKLQEEGRSELRFTKGTKCFKDGPAPIILVKNSDNVDLKYVPIAPPEQ